MKIIDLSKPIQYNKEDPWFMKVKIQHKPHRKAKWLLRFLGLPFKLFPKGFEGWADDSIKKMGVHATTHIDAPWHYSPTTNGQKAKTIDEVPLEWCYGEGLVIIEQLVNLDALPHSGFKVALFPLKIVGASAAPARVVAMMEEGV